MGYLLLILKAFSHQAETMIVRRYGQKHQVGGMFFNAVICLFSLVFFMATDKGGFYFPKALWTYGLISCAMFASGFYFMYAALKIGSFALTKLLSSFSGVITISYGIVILREHANWLTYVALALIFTSVFLMNFGKRDKSSEENKKAFSLKWLIYVVIVFVANGLIGVLQKEQQLAFGGRCDNEFMIISLAGAFLALMIFGLFLERERLGYIIKHGTLYGMGAGLLNGASNFTGILMFLYLPVSLSTPLVTGIGIILSFAISVLIYKESFNKMQIASALVGMVALVLLNIAKFI